MADWKTKVAAARTVREIREELERSNDRARDRRLVEEMLRAMGPAQECTLDEFEVVCRVKFDEDRDHYPAIRDVLNDDERLVGMACKDLAEWGLNPPPGHRAVQLLSDSALGKLEWFCAMTRHDNVPEDVTNACTPLWLPARLAGDDGEGR